MYSYLSYGDRPSPPAQGSIGGIFENKVDTGLRGRRVGK